MLKDKNVILGISGSIAAYKVATLASSLVKLNCNVHVIMTDNGTKFISPLTFETLTGNKTFVDTFDRNFQHNVEHISLAKQADLVMIAPASANIIAKLAIGLADDMLTTTVLASECKKVLSPAMNAAMYNNLATQQNIEKLEHFGWEIIVPDSGRLACGDVGVGKMPEPEILLETIIQELAFKKDMRGLNVLVTAGATIESIDPVRYITNHSTGKMGYAIARAASHRGASVTLVSGKSPLTEPPHMKVIKVGSAQDMFEQVTELSGSQDIIIKAAAVADYRPKNRAFEKLKKKDNNMDIELERTPDILQYLGTHRNEGQFICGFSMETQDLIRNSRDKLIRKNIDLIAANSLKTKGSGFGVDTNQLTLITRNEEFPLPLLTKDKAAHRLLDMIIERYKRN